jgi:hypothetical protein
MSSYDPRDHYEPANEAVSSVGGAEEVRWPWPASVRRSS